MANPEHLAIARKGLETWNEWREANPEIRVDLSAVDFTSDANSQISFAGYAFGNKADFQAAKFGNGASFENAIFGEHTNFSNASFGDYVTFSSAEFGFTVKFHGATFGIEANFSNTKFDDRAEFRHARFGRMAHFSGAAFGEDADFADTIFGSFAEFDHVTFNGGVFFDLFNEPNTASDSSAEFANRTNGFEEVKDPATALEFFGISFRFAHFHGHVSFANRTFRDFSEFTGARFDRPPSFRGTAGHQNLDWAGVQFGVRGDLMIGKTHIQTPGWCGSPWVITEIRGLRGIAKEIHAVDAERDLFILERFAERGVLWLEWWRGGWYKRFFGWWRPLAVTLLMGLYRCFSNCGRSLVLPLVWLGAANVGAYFVYRSLIDKAWTQMHKAALFDLTFASAIPFGATARPSFSAAVEVLFEDNVNKVVDIPWQVQVASAGQGIVNLILLFLFGLALRNYFKFR